MTKKPVPSASAVPTRLALFGPPPLLEGEDSAAYDELLALVSGSMKPADVLDEIWVRDLVDLIWETFRWRRLKTKLIAATTYKGVKAVLEPMIGWLSATPIAEGWARHDAKAIKEVTEQLASANLSMDAVMAQTLVANLTDIERIDRMTMNAEARRAAVMREVERHRTPRRVGDEIEVSQFKEITAPQITNRIVA